MELKRNYLTSDEIGDVVNQISVATDVYSKEMLKYGIVAQYIFGEEVFKDLETVNDIYDKVISEGHKLEEEIVNFDMIDKIYKEEHSIERQLEKFIDTTSKKLEKSMKKLPKDLKNFKLDEFLGQIKEAVDKNGK